jgi:hypothetical protein
MQRIEIVKMIFGSHLYGTNTEESDRDYKGIFLPSSREIFLGRIPKSINGSTKKSNESKNTSEDVDTEIYSLHYFIELACEGQTAALDMLFAPEDKILVNSIIWKDIVKNRDKFLTKNLQAFIGYARRQASKYGVKGSRLADAKKVLNFCKSLKDSVDWFMKIKHNWDRLPDGEHIHKLAPDENGIEFYQVCGRKIGHTCTLKQLHDVVYSFYNSYGDRARKAEINEGVDWKAVSHAFRAAYQIKEILTEGKITFPLKEADFLKYIKAGEYHYSDQLAPMLDALMDQVEDLSAKSNLPEKVDRKFWDDWLYDAVDRMFIGVVNWNC